MNQSIASSEFTSEADSGIPIRVMALHAFLYCERLFYLEEVEEIRLADAAVYAGRRLHDDVVSENDETPERRGLQLTSESWGIFGKVDAVRKRDGTWVPYEHKRGRCQRDDNKKANAWPSDRIQAVAYAVLLEEELGEPVPQARVRYHADNVTAFVEVNEEARKDLRRAIERARKLRCSTIRPPVAENENLCPRCSLAPICLPEEERLANVGHVRQTPKLFPTNRQRETLHVTSPRARIGRSGDTLVLTTDEGKRKLPIRQLDTVMLHGFAQISSQAVQLCAAHDVSVHWLSAGGRFVAGTSPSVGRVQQRIRQYQALTDEAYCLRLSRQLMHAKIEMQLKYLMRATRSQPEVRECCRPHLDQIREVLAKVPTATSLGSLLGYEGIAAKSHFASLPHLLGSRVPDVLKPLGRSKRPPRDRFNCLLSYGYSLIQSFVHRSIVAVGLEPALGFYHQPRSAAAPLVLDLMELFRTSLWEMPLIGSINRGQWQVADDFNETANQVFLTHSGRKKAIQLFQGRLTESYKHPFTGQSMTYARIVELELRLLEKEWTGAPGLFAQLRLR